MAQTWEQTASDSLGGQANYAVAQLKALNPTYDWSGAIQQASNLLTNSYPDMGWQDPGRGTPSGVVSAILNASSGDPNSPVNAKPDVLAAYRAKQKQEEGDIQAEQATHGGGGLGWGALLGLALIPFTGGISAAVAEGLGVSSAVASAITGGVSSILTGGNPIVGAITGGISGGFSGGSDFASGNIDVNGQALGDGASTAVSSTGGLINGGGVTYAAEQGTFDPNAAPELTTTDNPYPDTEVTPTSAPAGETGTFDPNAQGDMPAQAAPVDTSASLQNADGTWGSTAANSVAGGSGMVDPASSWLDNLKNLDPKLQAALAVAGGGLLSGALSGIGNYAATQSKIAADSALADKVSQNRIAEQAAIRNNNKVPGLLNLRPSAANAILRRADGTPYYKQG